ncbi:MAG: tRNA pseudouridine55 synthase [Patescibacteria group bacterium]|nr:tRNA pseudouridine55 synthase [Patescibacteria group bacterium]
MGIFNIYKTAGLTPLEALEKLRVIKPELIATKAVDDGSPLSAKAPGEPLIALAGAATALREKMTYAGRLDPLAEGVMLILSGEDIGRKDEFLNLSKTYEVEVLFGAGTDTGDVLGLVTELGPADLNIEEIKTASARLVGRQLQTAPRYSAPGIDGKEFAKEVEVYTVEVGDLTKILAYDLLVGIEKRVGEINGDFRQAKITDCWQKYLANSNQTFSVIKLTISASSGTYMRVLAEELGRVLRVPALAYKIKRTKVGEYTIADSLVL